MLLESMLNKSRHYEAFFSLGLHTAQEFGSDIDLLAFSFDRPE